MKKINQILTLSLIVGLSFLTFSCGDDDSVSPTSDTALILGQWDVITFERYDCENANNNFFNDCTDGSGAGCEIYEFLEGGIFNYVFSDGSKDRGTYEFLGANNEAISFSTQNRGFSGLWKVEGTTLNLTNDPGVDCSSEIVLEKVQ